MKIERVSSLRNIERLAKIIFINFKKILAKKKNKNDRDALPFFSHHSTSPPFSSNTKKQSPNSPLRLWLQDLDVAIICHRHTNHC